MPFDGRLQHFNEVQVHETWSPAFTPEGAKGGGKGGGEASTYVPRETPDNLRSKAYARVLDLISEGPIKGLVNGLKSVYFDNTPVQNADGSFNFTGVTVEAVRGYPDQPYLAGFPSTEGETAVTTEVKAAIPVVRAVDSIDADFLVVTVRIPSLLYQTTQGDVVNTSVDYAIDLKVDSGDYTQVVAVNVTGKTTSGYERQTSIPVAGAKIGYTLRVRRITADAPGAQTQDKTFFQSYKVVIDHKMTYPHSAVIGLLVDSELFGGRVANRSFDIYGILMRVPTNYNPDTRVYTGIWDGTWKTAYCNNPAFFLFETLTNARWGCGIPDEKIDTALIYTIAKHCDELVSDGKGGTEPRYTVNAAIQTREEAYAVLQAICSNFNAMPYWGASGVMVAQDAPADPEMTVTPANVIDGAFVYSGVSLKARHSVAIVWWNNPDENGRRVPMVVEDPDLIRKYGWKPVEVNYFGCTSPRQALVKGRWILDTEKTGTQTVTYRAALDGFRLRPGKIIRAADPAKQVIRSGGRVKAYTPGVVTLDAPYAFVAGGVYTLHLLQPNYQSGDAADLKVVSVAVINPGTTSTATVTLAGSLAHEPTPGMVWAITEASTTALQQWRVVTISQPEPHLVEVTALRHDPNKYARIEQGISIDTAQYMTVPSGTLPQITPSSIVTREYLYASGTAIQTCLLVGWEHVADPRKMYYAVEIRENAGPWRPVTRTSEPIVEIKPVNDGSTYEVRVRAEGSANSGAWAAKTGILIAGKSLPPSDVTGFRATIDKFGLRLRWDAIPDLDAKAYEIRRDAGGGWATSTAVDVVTDTLYDFQSITSGAHTFLIKALDTSDNPSTNAASVTVNIVVPAPGGVTSAFESENYRLSWSTVASSFQVDLYEVRYGTSFDAGTFVGTTKGTSYVAKIDWAGTRTFWIAAKDIAGNYGTAASVDVVASAPGKPTNLTFQTFSGVITLDWDAPSSVLPITKYEIRQGADWASGTTVGFKDGSFTTIQQLTPGAYTYWVAAINSAGQTGDAANVTVNVVVPDAYVFIQNWMSSFSGTKTKALLDNGRLYMLVNITETFGQHFTNNSWSTPQDQITAGYPYYIQPTTGPATYVETFDYGATYTNSILCTVEKNLVTVAGTVTLDCTIEISTNGSSWTTYSSVWSKQIANFRYIRVTITATGNNATAFGYLDMLRVKLDATKVTDAGFKTCNAGDSGGTTVTFNKAFIDITSIQAQVLGTASYKAVVDFADVANPTTFKVLVFNDSGTRVTADVYWNAEGI